MISRMKSFVLLIFILQAIDFQPITAYHTFSSERLLRIKDSHFRPLVTKSFDQFIYVTFPMNYLEPRIRLEWEKIGYTPCEIGFNSITETEFPLSLNTLADGKLLLSLLQATRDNSLSLEKNRGIFSLIIDPETCRFNSVLTALNNKTVKNMDIKESIFVLTGEKVFDIFLMAGHANCTEGTACRLRYDEEGKLIYATDFNLDVEDKDVDRWSVNSIRDKALSDGFFYTVLTKNETIVKRLDEELNVDGILELNDSFIFSDNNGAISRCRGLPNSELGCDLYDMNLGPRSGVAASRVEARTYKNYIRNIRMFNLPEGGAIIFLVMQVYDLPGSLPEAKMFSTYIQNIDRYGRPGRVFKFQDDICKDFTDVKMSTMKDNHCFSVFCPFSVQTKCVVFDASV
ncbi:uncharacterized protein LOC100678493 [Nasonia vitripennis]|uniref:Uncharacterized protein n=1 Tax=Nasonia vitripennis TaxID=7425 RepID=A0A7M7GFE1_NASVI|nr:uncharacterized protein LOC100678493 [Nasonia vitripennis]